MEVSFEATSLRHLGCPVNINVERTSDGWYNAEGSNCVLRIDSQTPRIPFGKFRVPISQYPVASVYVQYEPGADWKIAHSLCTRSYLPPMLVQPAFRVVTVFHPVRKSAHEVWNTKAEIEEMALASTDDDVDASNKTSAILRMIPKK